jgi:hypothetical protein
MNKYSILGIASFFIFITLAGSVLLLRQAAAAPPAVVNSAKLTQAGLTGFQSVSVSALAFIPASPNAIYFKDIRRQFLTLNQQTRNFAADTNLFIAPLTLPDQSLLTGLTIFGEDFDNLGEVRVYLQRCDHSQPRCLTVAEATSTPSYALGQFETAKLSPINELINNNLFSYFLELELTALFNSGLRAVRLELGNGNTAPPSGNLERWSLAGETTNFRLPTQNSVQARICTDDLSHLDNPTHYPMLIVDGRLVTSLSSNTCVTVSGFNIELRRELNTGPSSGTYQFLR